MKITHTWNHSQQDLNYRRSLMYAIIITVIICATVLASVTIAVDANTKNWQIRYTPTAMAPIDMEALQKQLDEEYEKNKDLTFDEIMGAINDIEMETEV